MKLLLDSELDGFQKKLEDECSKLELALDGEKNALENSLKLLKEEMSEGLNDVNDSIHNFKENVKDELNRERNERLRDRETFYEDMEKCCSAIDEKLVIVRSKL